eukprot:TRINITY_DN2956_c0_g1_i8.p1 TRINITY_DN2956_c0_g1~~TRINITY_DN2956_c0_g1_i8.p1  ORF type:complete len:102 (+),score=35.81 TRINITY_DN2956_c0_g1_i8:126-431(+)
MCIRDREISVLFELNLGHPRFRLMDVPPQPNSPPDFVIPLVQSINDFGARTSMRYLNERLSKIKLEAVVFYFFFFFFSSRRRHTRCREVSWARRCVQETAL